MVQLTGLMSIDVIVKISCNERNKEKNSVFVCLHQPADYPAIFVIKNNTISYYRSGTVNSNTVNSKFNLIRSFF